MPTRPCWVEIRTRNLENNFRFLAGLVQPEAELLAIVKADAYGHSLQLCTPAVIRAGAGWLGVTSVEEGAAARAVAPDVRILVIGGVFPGQGMDVVLHRLTVVVWETWQLDEIEAAARATGSESNSIAVHLEIDTGMSRQGAGRDGLQHLLSRFTPTSPLRLEGVMTHLFAADEADGRITAEQLARMDTAVAEITSAGLLPEWLNVGNSAALLGGQAPIIASLAARHGMKALLRPGLALYGLVPEFDPAFEPSEPQTLANARTKLEPVLTWKSKVVSVRSIPAGAAVGYNGTFVATEPMQLALVAAGYADGLDRRLGNRMSVLVHGQPAPFVGRISMDQSVLDVTEIPGVEPDDEVVLLGAQGSECVSAFDHARVDGTIPWEIFTRIGPRVLRIPV